MIARLLEIHPDNPQHNKIEVVARILNEGGIIIYPTDTVYSYGCLLGNKRGIERIARLKKIKLRKANFSLILGDISDISNYTKHYSRASFKLINKSLPGPYTFILPASNSVSRLFENKRREVGIRIPNNSICLELMRELGEPIVTSSVREDDDIVEYLSDPNALFEKHKNEVDLFIDGGVGSLDPSTVINCTKEEPELVRQGIGEF